MSLRVWYPFNGNNKNYGASITDPNQTPSYVAGKIGQCANLTTYFDMREDSSVWNVNTHDVSFAGWFKFNQTKIAKVLNDYTYNSTYTTPTGTLIGYNSYGGFSLTWTSNAMYPTKSFTSMNVRGAIRSPSALNGGRLTEATDITFDQWTHLALTINRTTHAFSLYKNGTLISSVTLPEFSDVGNISDCYININTVWGGNGPSFRIPMYVNDVRVYDHCLSLDEIKDLSKALVLYYPLNNGNIEPTTNLVTGLTAGGQTTVSNGVVTTSGTNADTYFTIKLSESIVQGTTYTLSCDAEGLPDGVSWGFPMGWQGNTGLTMRIYNGHNEYTFTANSGTWGTNQLFMDDNDSSQIRASGKVTKMYNFQLEKKNHATPYTPSSRTGLIADDCSGYNRNGTATGNIQITTGSGRGNHCTSFSGGNNTAIQIPFTTAVVTGEFTASMWFYKSEFSSYSWDTIFGGPSGFELETKNGSNNTPVIYAYSWGQGSFEYTLNTWHHLVMTRNSTETKFYLDGTLKLTGSAGSIPGGSYFIGAWMDTAHQLYKGLVSDFRVYASVLSADDISKLYHNFASIYKNGSLSAYDFLEV